MTGLVAQVAASDWSWLEPISTLAGAASMAGVAWYMIAVIGPRREAEAHTERRELMARYQDLVERVIRRLENHDDEQGNRRQDKRP